jgi:hypothetical protein
LLILNAGTDTPEARTCKASRLRPVSSRFVLPGKARAKASPMPLLAPVTKAARGRVRIRVMASI